MDRSHANRLAWSNTYRLCWRSLDPPPAELSPLTEVAARLFRAEHQSDTATIRLLVADHTGLVTADGLQTLHPDLVNDGLRSLRPLTPYLLSPDSAYIEYQVRSRRSPVDLIAIRFVRRDSAWLIASIRRPEAY